MLQIHLSLVHSDRLHFQMLYTKNKSIKMHEGIAIWFKFIYLQLNPTKIIAEGDGRVALQSKVPVLLFSGSTKWKILSKSRRLAICTESWTDSGGYLASLCSQNKSTYLQDSGIFLVFFFLEIYSLSFHFYLFV